MLLKPVNAFLRQNGGNVTVKRAGKGGSTIIAFVEDPDGYKIEFDSKDAGRGLGN